VPLAVLGLLLLPAAGAPYARLADLRGALFWSAAWLLGCGVVAGGMVCLSIVHIPFSRVALGVEWCAIITVGLVLEQAFKPRSLRTGRSGTARISSALDQRVKWGLVWLQSTFSRSIQSLKADPIVLVMLVICAAQVLYTLLAAIRVPLGSFDAWSLWEYKGRLFWLNGGITTSFLTDSASVFAHPAYPPLIPLLIAWQYTWIGAADSSGMKPLFSLYYAALVLAFYAGLQARAGQRVAVLGACCLVLIPRITDYAGTGLADVPLAAYVVAAAAAFVAAGPPPFGTRIRLSSAVFLGLAACTKHDGLVYLGTALPLLVFVGSRIGIQRTSVAAYAVAAALIALPWYCYVAWIHAPDRDFLAMTPSNIVDHANRLPEIAQIFGLDLLAVDQWSVLWYVAAVLLVRAVIKRQLRAPVLIAFVVIPLGFYVLALSLSAWPDYMLHVRTSVDRLTLVTAPFALWFAIEQCLGRSHHKEFEGA